MQQCHPMQHIFSAIANLHLDAVYQYVCHSCRIVIIWGDFIRHFWQPVCILLRGGRPLRLGIRGIMGYCRLCGQCIIGELDLISMCCLLLEIINAVHGDSLNEREAMVEGDGEVLAPVMSLM